MSDVHDFARTTCAATPTAAGFPPTARLSVVAGVSWRQSLAWLRTLAQELPVFLYSAAVPPPRAPARWVKVWVRNHTGPFFEHHAYLSHMVSCYDALTPMVAFLLEDSHDGEFRAAELHKPPHLHGGDVVAKVRRIAQATSAGSVVHFLPLGWMQGHWAIASAGQLVTFPPFDEAKFAVACFDGAVEGREWLRMVGPPRIALPPRRSAWAKALFVSSAQRVVESHSRRWYADMLTLASSPPYQRLTGWCFETTWDIVFGSCDVWDSCEACGDDCGPCRLVPNASGTTTPDRAPQPLPRWTALDVVCDAVGPGL